ncbi:MAG: ABC transporter ATP-binding protein [Pseudothermotoga sp.]
MKIYLEMRDIHKTFSVNKTKALNGANLVVEKGTIHALLGENGAGKTTLMRILCGLEKMDYGQIFLDGEPVTIRNLNDARKLGIAMVHQHFSLIEDFTALENIVLQRMAWSLTTLDLKSAEQEVSKIMTQTGLVLDLRKKTRDLSVEEKQKLEILRAVYMKAELLILDEPTSYLSEIESEQLLKVMRNLKELGKTIIFITHEITDAISVADHITVLRNGRTVYYSKDEKPSFEKLAYLMAGETNVVRSKRRRDSQKVLLKVDRLTFETEKQLVGPISFDTKEGEIVGLVGFAFSGAAEILEAIAGMRKILSGKIDFQGVDITFKTIKERRKIGLAYIPQQKTQIGLSLQLSIADNLIATNYERFSHFGWLSWKEVEGWSKKVVEKYQIKVDSIWQRIETLSGGNQQRILLARELELRPKLLIASNPTAGLDLRSVSLLKEIFLKLRQEGSSILLYSTDLGEILDLCDRIFVLSKGALAEEFLNDGSVTKTKLIEAMLSREKNSVLA